MRIRTVGYGILALALASCATAPAPRVGGTPPEVQRQVRAEVSLAPTPSWPVRWTSAGPRPGNPVAPDWQAPLYEPPIALGAPLAGPRLPLPDPAPLPVKETPGSRSWTVVTQAKPASPLLVPSVPASAATPAKAETKPATVPAKPAVAAPEKASAPPTAAATASLLPAASTDGADFRWEDVNSSTGDAVTLHFDKTNWIYLDSPAQQKALGFQSITRDKDSTTFLFKPPTAGNYILEFQRQDLTTQSTEVRKVRLHVAKPGTRTAVTASPVPQTTSSSEDLEASRQLAASGKTAEAVQKLLQSYKAEDSRVNLELGRLLNRSGQDDEALTYLDRNLSLPGPDLQGTLELGTKLAASREPQKKLPTYVKVWTSGSLVPGEDLYLQVFDVLRTQKMTVLLKDWAARYPGWYPTPAARDRYLFQLGQWLEEPGDARDVRGSWKAYNEVVQSYPLSPYWKAAGERAAYINRHFLQVR